MKMFIFKCLGMLTAAAMMYAAGYLDGRSNEREAVRQRQADAQRAAVEKHNAAVEAGQVVEKDALAAETRQDELTRRLVREVRVMKPKPRPVPVAPHSVPAISAIPAEENFAHVKAPPSLLPDFCRPDPELVRLWRAANRGAGLDAAGVAGGTAGGGTAATAGESELAGTGREPHRDGGAVSRVAGAVFGTGSMDRSCRRETR